MKMKTLLGFACTALVVSTASANTTEIKQLQQLNQRLDQALQQKNRQHDSTFAIKRMDSHYLLKYWQTTYSRINPLIGKKLKRGIYLNGVANFMAVGSNVADNQFEGFPNTAQGLHFTDANVNIMAKPVSWLSLNYNNDLQSDRYFVGNPTETHYFLTVAPKKLPLYLFAGDKITEFGQFNNYSQFSLPLTQQFFQAQGAQVGIGIKAHGFNASVSGVRGRNISIGSTGQAYNGGNNLNTVIANASMKTRFVTVGGGYTQRTVYAKSNTKPAGFIQFYDGDAQGAWDSFLSLHAAGVKIYGEYIRTTGKAELITDYGERLTTASNKAISSWDAGIAYNNRHQFNNKVINWILQATYFGDYSELSFNNNIDSTVARNTTINRLQRSTIGWKKTISPLVHIEFDYVHNDAPTNNFFSWQIAQLPKQDAYLAGLTVTL